MLRRKFILRFFSHSISAVIGLFVGRAVRAADKEQIFSTSDAVGDTSQSAIQSLMTRLADTSDQGSGSGMIGFKQLGVNTVSRTSQDKLRERITPLDFGAVGNGLVDDSLAIERVILDGRPVDFLGMSYLLTKELRLDVPHAIDWDCRGASFFYAPSKPTQSIIRLKIRPYLHQIRGPLIIDAGQKAFIGFWMISEEDTLGSFPNGYPDLSAQGLCVRNIYRSSKQFIGGDGIRIEGGWNNVNLQEPRVENILMASQAGVPGKAGIFGITVMRISPSSKNICPHHIRINDPFVDSVYSEDSNYQLDQDGIRLYTSYGYQSPQIGEFSVHINGATIRNCRNRSIKIQSNLATVSNTKLVRTSEVGGQSIGNVADIDFQMGSGMVSNLEFHYTDYVPASVIQFTDRPQDRDIPYSSVNNVAGFVSKDVVLPRFATIRGYSDSGSRWVANFININIAGNVDAGFFIQPSNLIPDYPAILNIVNFVGNLKNSLVNAVFNRDFQGDFRINATNCVNRGTHVDILNGGGERPEIRRQISATSCMGFSNYARRGPGEVPAAMLVDSFLPDNSQFGPLTRFLGYSIDDGKYVDLPKTAADTSGLSGMIEVSCSMNDTGAQGIFAVSSTKIEKIAGGALWQAGDTSEPSSGAFRIWVANGVVRVANRSGATRVLGVWMK